MDAPEYTIASLQAELRGARERADKLEAENAELRRQRDESDEIRSAIVSASTDMAFDTAVAMGRIEQLTALADAASDWDESFDLRGPLADHQRRTRHDHLRLLASRYRNVKRSRS